MRIATKVLLFLQILAVILIPLVVFHKTSELFELNKMVIVYVISIFSLGISLYVHLLNKNINIPKILFIPLGLYFVSQLVATLFSIDIYTSFYGYYGRFNGGLLSLIAYIAVVYSLSVYFQIVGYEEAQKSIKKIMTISMMISALIILWAIPSLFGKDMTCLLFTGMWTNDCWIDMFKPAERMFSTLGQPNWLGAYLTIIFFIGLGMFASIKNSFKFLIRITTFIWIGLMIFGILSTRSRSALVAFVLLFSLWFIFLTILNIKKIHKIEWKNLVLLLIIVLVLFVTKKTGISSIDRFILKLTKPNTQVVTLQEKAPTASLVTDSFDIRKIVWLGGVEIIKKYPLFGTGPETFAYSYYQTRPKEHNLTSEWDYVYNKAHNEFLHIATGSGLIGLISYVMYIAIIGGMMCIYTILTIKKKEKSMYIQAGLLLAWVSIHITNFVGFSTTSINWYFYIIPVFSYFLYHRYEKNRITLRKIKRKGILFFFIGIIMIVGIVRIGYFFVADMLYAQSDVYEQKGLYYEHYVALSKALKFHYEHVYEDKLAYATAQLALVLSSTEGSESETIQLLMRQADFHNLHTLSVAPKNIFYWRTRAKIMYLFDAIKEDENYYKKGVDAIETAIRLAPTDPRLYYTYATIEMMHVRNKKLNVKTKEFITGLFNQAIALKPNYRDAYISFGQWFEQMGESEKARANYQYVLDKINPADQEALDGVSRN